MTSDSALLIASYAWSAAVALFALVGVVWLARYWQSAVRRELFREYVYPVATSEDIDLVRRSFHRVVSARGAPGHADVLEPMSYLLAKYAIDKKAAIKIVVQESRTLEKTAAIKGETNLVSLAPAIQSEEAVGRVMAQLKIDPSRTRIPLARPLVLRALAKATRLYLEEIQLIIIRSLRAHL